MPIWRRSSSPCPPCPVPARKPTSPVTAWGRALGHWQPPWGDQGKNALKCQPAQQDISLRDTSIFALLNNFFFWKPVVSYIKWYFLVKEVVKSKNWCTSKNYAMNIQFKICFFLISRNLKTLKSSTLENIEGEYIKNLQQQIYFLELESNYLYPL